MPMFSKSYRLYVFLQNNMTGAFDIFAYWLYHEGLPDRDDWDSAIFDSSID
jgi:hypothetical protein